MQSDSCNPTAGNFEGYAISERDEVTWILQRAGEGDAAALNELMPLVYDELRLLAERHMARERPGHTLQPTALANEVFLKLVDQSRVQWQGRAHFFAIASRSIRRILADHARGRERVKRGGEQQRVALDEEKTPRPAGEIDILEIDDALSALAALHPRQAQIVELRFFGGLSMEEIAEVTGVSLRTVAEDWKMAKAWLRRELSGSDAT
jgi:RNA polymerase sigma factor (TIGR02999 family)